MADYEQTSSVFITRQPILDLKNQVFGYELLYRTDPSTAIDGDTDEDAVAVENADSPDTLESTESDHASSRVLADAVLALGLDALTSGLPAFVKFSRNLLLSDAATLLPAKSVVIELSGDIEVDGEVIDACSRLQDLGYAISLDDYTAGTDAEAALLSYVKFARVDMLQTAADDRKALADRLQPLGLQLIAKKIETAEMAAEVKALGYKLFQGYYFCKPTKVKAKGMPERRLAYLNLLSALNRENLTVSELEELVKHDVSLSVRVLRMINSAAYSLRHEVTSIRQALVLLGLDQIRKSASVWALAGANGGGTQEVVAIALLRARCCELVGAELPGAEDGGGFFLMGLCSLLDAIVGKPIEEAVADMPLPAPIKGALLGEKNNERMVLDAVVAYEQGEWDASTKLLKKLKLKVSLPDVYADALRWARELSRTAQAA
jgi:EAL and modified HD-GYP domain-containing signal transduction protein